MILRSITTASLLLAAGIALADTQQMNALDKQQFAAWDAQIKTDLDQSTRYKEIASADQETVKATLAKMEAIWGRADSNGKLGVEDTIAIGNDQEIVTTILNHAAADSRLVCDRETPMGTNISKRVCRTVADLKRERNNAQGELQDMQRQQQQRPSN